MQSSAGSDPDACDIVFGPRLVHRARFVTGLSVLESGAGLLGDLVMAEGGTGRALVVVDGGLAAARPGIAHQLARLVSAAGLTVPVAPMVAPGGEAIKNDPRRVDELVRAMHDAGLCRRSCVIAVGGGAVLDAVGFAAAMVHRGVRLIRVPTTTLAQADSCVAVKCGVNAFGKKNYLGAFAAPWAVVVDPSLLRTLSDRDWRSGFSEAVKVGLVKDASLFEEIEQTAPRIAARDIGASWPVIRRSAELHLRHITDGGDPFELSHARPLDFGHWAAHRLESMTGHRLRHGEAVAIGVALDAAYSELRGWLSPGETERIHRTLRSLGFTLWDPSMSDGQGLMAGLDEFREHLGGRLTIAMLRGIGEGFDVHDIDTGAMREAVARLWAAGQAGARTAG